MTTPTLKLSDLAGPDADGWSDVAVFVRADGSESEPFVIVSDVVKGRNVTVNYGGLRGEVTFTGGKVRRLGRGRLVPARIEMEVETGADLAEMLEIMTGYAESFERGDPGQAGPEFYKLCRKVRAALAATAPTPTEAAK